MHSWAKRPRGEAVKCPQALVLLDSLSPMFSERELQPVKGVGWRSKTMGRYYPQETADWLCAQAARPDRKLLLSKALTYLTPPDREEIIRRCGRGT